MRRTPRARTQTGPRWRSTIQDADGARERQRDAVAPGHRGAADTPESRRVIDRAHKWNVNHLNDAWFADEADTRAKAGLRRVVVGSRVGRRRKTRRRVRP